jgi:hypothetical protein
LRTAPLRQRIGELGGKNAVLLALLLGYESLCGAPKGQIVATRARLYERQK